jgi:hypothetical protein
MVKAKRPYTVRGVAARMKRRIDRPKFDLRNIIAKLKSEKKCISSEPYALSQHQKKLKSEIKKKENTNTMK